VVFLDNVGTYYTLLVSNMTFSNDLKTQTLHYIDTHATFLKLCFLLWVNTSLEEESSSFRKLMCIHCVVCVFKTKIKFVLLTSDVLQNVSREQSLIINHSNLISLIINWMICREGGGLDRNYRILFFFVRL